MKALFDTNILIDYRNGIAAAKKELALYESRAISIVTRMELMSEGEPTLESTTRAYLNQFTVIPVG